jgi:hypothetical protein
MNLPFSFLEILERLMPGAAFVGVLAFLPPFTIEAPPQAAQFTDPVLLGGLFVTLSYTLGFVFNLVSGASRSVDKALLNRRDSNAVAGSDEKLKSLGQAFTDVFGFEISSESWRLCYGIAEKSGYGVRISLFSSLEIFCRSLFVASFLLSIIYIFSTPASSFNLSLGLFSLVLAAIFAYGAQVYSRAFTAAIFEAFHTWYMIDRKPL